MKLLLSDIISAGGPLTVEFERVEIENVNDDIYISLEDCATIVMKRGQAFMLTKLIQGHVGE